MLDRFDNYRAVWCEITRSDHGHGGPGWEFGTCLWSPARNRAGQDRYRLMREVQKGDLVLHLYHDAWPDGGVETRLCGRSRVAAPYYELQTEPPSRGSWGGLGAYYRVNLTGFAWFPAPISLHVLDDDYGLEIRHEILEADPKYYPFATYGAGIRLSQGMYIAACTHRLYFIFTRALGIEAAAHTAQVHPEDVHDEYAEGERARAERYFFARNASLAKRAKEHYGCTCQICGFHFGQKYGQLGANYIECHHLNPISERPEAEWNEQVRTRLDDVAVVCSNCHRMLHRRKPALSLEELRRIMDSCESGEPR